MWCLVHRYRPLWALSLIPLSLSFSFDAARTDRRAQDIIKDTPEEHPDYEDLCRGLEEVERLAKGMNRAAKMTNNTRKILDIENMFNGDLVRFCSCVSVVVFSYVHVCSSY